MPVASLVSCSPSGVTFSVGPRFIHRRTVERVAPRHGEKRYEQLVAEAFDGPVLRLSEKLRLLEEADNRRIRRGDALELMSTIQQELEAAHDIPRAGRLRRFARRFCVFAAAYALLALAACVIVWRF